MIFYYCISYIIGHVLHEKQTWSGVHQHFTGEQRALLCQRLKPPGGPWDARCFEGFSQLKRKKLVDFSGWWFQICFIVPYIGNVIIPIDELIFFRGVQTTNQFCIDFSLMDRWVANYFCTLELFFSGIIYGLHSVVWKCRHVGGNNYSVMGFEGQPQIW